jgi:hypothetical protein
MHDAGTKRRLIPHLPDFGVFFRHEVGKRRSFRMRRAVRQNARGLPDRDKIFFGMEHNKRSCFLCMFFFQRSVFYSP